MGKNGAGIESAGGSVRIFSRKEMDVDDWSDIGIMSRNGAVLGTF